MKATPAVLAAAGAAVAAVVATVVILGDQRNDPVPDTSKAPASETIGKQAGITPATAGIDPVLWEPPTRPVFPKLAAAAINPARCAPVQKQAEGLIAEFEKKVTPSDREAARKVVAETVQQGQSQAEGYNLFAGGEMLKGNLIAAAWGALRATNAEWEARFVANVGVYLIDLERLDDADGFLNCARELDPRSPFVIEAQAMLSHRRNDCNRAKELIELAVRIMPGDMNVRYSAGIIHHRCGDRAKALYYLRAAEREKPDDETVKQAIRVVDPSSADRPRQRDALDLLVEESLAFLDEMMARGELASDYAQDVLKGPSVGQSLNQDFAAQMRKHVAEAKIKIRQRHSAARDTGAAAPPDPVAWNFTLVETVGAYLQAILDYEQLSRGMGRFLIMSAAMRMDPVVYSDKYAGKQGGERDREFVLLDENDKYQDAMKPLHARHSRCLTSAGSVAASQACERELCASAMPLWEAYKSAVERNMAAAEAGFPHAAEDYGNYWLAYRFRGADYARRAVKALKPTPQTSQVAAIIAQTTNQQLDALVQMFVGTTLAETSQRLQSALEGAPGEVMGDGQFSSLCPAGRPNKIPLDPPIDPFLAALMEATKFETGGGIDCESKIGGFGVQLKSKDGRDWQLKVSETVGKVSYGTSVGTGGRIGGEVSYSQSASAHGVAAKGTVKLWGESRPGGQVNYGAQVEGKLGAGVTYGGQGVSCYFVSGKATFNARVFAASLAG